MAFPALAAWGHKHLLANGFRPRPGDPHDGHTARPRGRTPFLGEKAASPHFNASHAKAVAKELLLDVIETGFP